MQEARIIPTFDCGHHRLSVDINPTIDQDLSYCVHQDQPKATFLPAIRSSQAIPLKVKPSEVFHDPFSKRRRSL